MSTFSCSNCTYSTKTKGNLKIHLANVCTEGSMVENIVKVECGVCKKTFETLKSLEVHKKTCIKKKLEIINKDAGGLLQNQIDALVTLVKAQQSEIDALKVSVKKLIPQDKKKEECSLEGQLCSHNKKISFIPTSKQQILEKLEELGQEDPGDGALTVTVDGQRDMEVDAYISDPGFIEVDDDKYYYSYIRGKKCADAIKVKVVKYCDKEATKMKGDNYFCERH